MLKILMLVSGGFEFLFGASLLVLILKGSSLGGIGREGATLLGVWTFLLGLAALIMHNRLDTAAGMGTAYTLWLYNVIAAVALIYAALDSTDHLIRGGAAIHTVLGLLLTYALFMPAGGE